MKSQINLQIQPIGDIARETLDQLATDLKTIFNDIEILKPIPIVESAYNPDRNQYLTDEFLQEVKRVSPGHVLGVTEVDLYTPHLNFVFGQAELPGRVAVISLNRLHHDEPEVFYSRILKEAVHELGHTLGLKHCEVVHCVMHFSNSLMDTDVKLEVFCKKCEELLLKT
jgi:archaemetzincin